MRYVIFLSLALSACASGSDRVVDRAMRGLAFDAYYHATPGGNPKTLQFLESRADFFLIAVTYQPTGHEDLSGATGRFTQKGPIREIVVAGDLSINGRLEVLAHELGHAFSPPLSTKMEHEVFAELVAVEVCRRLGVDTSRTVARYLQMHKSAFGVAKSHRLEIAFVADILTKGFR